MEGGFAKGGGGIKGVEAYEPKLTDFANTIKKLVGTYYPIPKNLKSRPVVFVEEKAYYRHRLDIGGPLDEILPDSMIWLSGLYTQNGDRLRKSGAYAGARAREERGPQPTIDFDALFIPDSPKKVGLILPQLAFYDVKDVILVGTNLWHSDQLINMTKGFAQNTLMVDGFFKDSQSAVVQGFIGEYRRLYDQDPGIIEAFAFDTANLLFTLLNRGDVLSRPDMRLALKQSLTTEGATGPVYFADDGEAIKRLSLLRIKGGRFVEIGRP